MGNRTQDRPTCSIAPQSTTLPRAPWRWFSGFGKKKDEMGSKEPSEEAGVNSAQAWRCVCSPQAQEFCYRREKVLPLCKNIPVILDDWNVTVCNYTVTGCHWLWRNAYTFLISLYYGSASIDTRTVLIHATKFINSEVHVT
jgi:hypothetical protein